MNSMVKKINKHGGLKKVGWAGGANQAENAADIAFVGNRIAGISVKADGGITLANLSPNSVGLTPDRGNDIFYHYAQKEFVDMKTKIFTAVMKLAKSTPGKPVAPLDKKYNIVYDAKTDTYTCHGKNVFKGDASTILSHVAKNAGWQRVFGDWFQANWQTHKSYATPLFAKISNLVVKIIQSHLSKSEHLSHMLRFAKQPYFYFSSTGLYYVPSVDEVSDLQLRALKYASPDGTAQLFVAQIGRPGSSEVAEVDIYIRYGNGMFETNPAVRIQTLRNPQYIGWEKLA
jgi:hypothetical protein